MTEVSLMALGLSRASDLNLRPPGPHPEKWVQTLDAIGTNDSRRYGSGTVRSDPSATEDRYRRLSNYMAGEVLAPHGFCCASESACRGSLKPDLEFSPGQLSFLGRHYDLTVESVPLRILVLGMDTGRTDTSVGLDQRRQQIYDRIPEAFNKRNSHMRGTTLALRVLLGRESWDTPGDEYLALDHARVHLLDAYAMANLRLCSATKPPTTTSRATTMMSRNCLRHLRATIELLEPTIVVTQSVAIRRRIDSASAQRLVEPTPAILPRGGPPHPPASASVRN
jgi:hypothetical protein